MYSTFFSFFNRARFKPVGQNEEYTHKEYILSKITPNFKDLAENSKDPHWQ